MTIDEIARRADVGHGTVFRPLHADLEHIEVAVPTGAAAGSRYAEFLMGELDGERSAA